MLNLAYIKERLLAKRAEIHSQMALFAQDHAPTEDPSLDEGGQDYAETAIDFQTSQQDPLIGSNEQHLLAEVHAALERLKQGTYGMCIVCGQPIPEKRLEALPWAARCVKDEEQLEQRIESHEILRDYPY